MKQPWMDPVVPYKAMDKNDFEDMIRLREATGIHRFLLVGLHNGVRITGYPADEDYWQFAETLRFIMEKTAPYGIEVGWWCLPTLKTGPSPFQAIVDISGKPSPISTCPLDARFAADFCRRVQIVLRHARPGIMLLEDDFQLSNHPGFRLGCFCPEHLKRFAQYAKRACSREELEQCFTATPPRDVELRKLWARLSHDTMVEFSRKLRRAVDEVAPDTRIWQCEPGTTDLDGGLSCDVARALAGDRTRPCIRIYGTQYGSSDIGRDIPANMAHAMYSAEHLPADFELLHESDTYPHNRYFSSASLMRSIMTGAMMMGCDNSLFIGAQYLDNHLEEFGYFQMYRQNMLKFRELQRCVRDGELDGCQVLYKPEFEFIRADQTWVGNSGANCLKNCTSLLGRFGIPYTTRERRVKLLSRAAAECLSDAELRSVLGSAALIDMDAALLLQARGFGRDWLGVSVECVGSIPATEEVILPVADCPATRGRMMYNFAHAPSGTEAASYGKLTLYGAEALTEYRGPRDRVLQPGLTRFVNRYGGKIAVLGCSFSNQSSNLYNYRKKELLHHLLTWLNSEKLPAVVLDAPNVWILCNNNARRTILMVTNFSPDPIEDLSIEVADTLRNRPVEELDLAGQWHTIPAIGGRASYMEPRIFRICK